MKNIKCDFSREDLEIIITAALDLISKKELTAINLIHSKKGDLPTNKIIIHHLQSSLKHLKHIQLEVKKRYQDANFLLAPRFTFYKFEPEYLNKPNFQEDYKGAKFFNSKLELIDINTLHKNPEGKIVANEELDLLIFGLNAQATANLAELLVALENKGPSPWLDPAIIIKDKGIIQSIYGYVRKDYASLVKKGSEFYSVLPKRGRKAILRHINDLCWNIKGSKLKIKEDSLLISKAFINSELNEYIKRNI